MSVKGWNMEKQNYNFEIIFKKLSEPANAKDQIAFSEELRESQEINKLREIVIDASEENGQFFSTP